MTGLACSGCTPAPTATVADAPEATSSDAPGVSGVSRLPTIRAVFTWEKCMKGANRARLDYHFALDACRGAG